MDFDRFSVVVLAAAELTFVLKKLVVLFKQNNETSAWKRLVFSCDQTYFVERAVEKITSKNLDVAVIRTYARTSLFFTRCNH